MRWVGVVVVFVGCDEGSLPAGWEVRGSPEVTADDTLVEDVPVVTTPANGSQTNGQPTYAGTLPATPPAGTEVAIFVDGAEVARVTPSSTTWTLTPTIALADGLYRPRFALPT